MEQELLTTRQAGEYLHVSPATLATWRSRGKGPAYIRIGGAIRYHIQDLESYLLVHSSRYEPGNSRTIRNIQ
jgi:predicted site-specific integrase-resolvase